MKYKFYVYDWNPNGCNDLVVQDAKTGNFIDGFQDALFGIDVNRLKSKPVEIGPDEFGYRIPKAIARKHIAVSPFGVNCPELKKYLK